jgi:hypothetical protein
MFKKRNPLLFAFAVRMKWMRRPSSKRFWSTAAPALSPSPSPPPTVTFFCKDCIHFDKETRNGAQFQTKVTDTVY